MDKERPLRTPELAEPRDTGVIQQISAFTQAIRPKEWVKNLLVFTGVIFSGSLVDTRALVVSVLGFILFCLASSGIYLVNDLCDLTKDQEHPVKRNRPLASGRLNVQIARAAALVFLLGSLAGSLALNQFFAAVIGAYIAICLAYSFKLKEYVILDVILIAIGFVLRAVSGAVLIGVEASLWLVLCTSMVALLIGFGKRRSELSLLENGAGRHRANLDEYTLEFLDSLMNICAGAAVITYALYTLAPETITRVGWSGMLFTIPFVIYGIFRYLYIVHREKGGGDPAQLLFSDRPMQLTIALWVSVVCAVVYIPTLRGH